MTVRDKSQNGACKARRSGGGLVEERKQPCGFLALRPAEVIPPESPDSGSIVLYGLISLISFLCGVAVLGLMRKCCNFTVLPSFRLRVPV
jgi:hypothetical protein